MEKRNSQKDETIEPVKANIRLIDTAFLPRKGLFLAQSYNHIGDALARL